MELTPEHGRNEGERRFLARLEELQPTPEWCDVWLHDRVLVVSAYVVDHESRVCIRTLRVDFDGAAFVAGNDPTHQFSGEIALDDPDRFVPVGVSSPEDLADTAMGWFRAQAARPIERQEWDHDGYRSTYWVLADTGRRLVASTTVPGNRWISSALQRPPDRVVKLPAFPDGPEDG